MEGYDGRACMRISRIAHASLVLLIGVMTELATAPPVYAQDVEVVLRLEAQTPWTTTEQPVLRLAVQAANLGAEPVEDLSLGVALGAAVRARNEYERILVEGPPFVVFAPAPTPVEGPLDPGAERTIRLEADLTGAVSDTDSLVYPAEVTLFAEGRPAATLVTPLLHLVREPQVPIPFTWWTTLAGGPAFDPAGRLADTGFEAAISPGGRLSEAVKVLARIAARELPTSIEVVVEPLLLEQLSAMSDGYERADGVAVEAATGPAADAQDLLDRLREAVADPSVHSVTLPYAAPELPAMLRSGLIEDLDRQYELGSELMLKVLGREGDGTVAAAPDQALDDAALSYIAQRGASVVLAHESAVGRPEQTNFFAPPPTATLPLPDGDEMALVLPDPGAQALIEEPALRADPVRLAQAVLGELAVVWREQPVPIPPTVRGLALSLPNDLPAAAWLPLVQRLARAPFLEGTPAATLVSSVNPPGEVTALAAPSATSFSDAYARSLRAAGLDVDALEGTVVGPSDDPADLRRLLAVAEAGAYLGAEGPGRLWIAAVIDRTETRFDRLAPLPDQVFTLTSPTGTIPIRFGDTPQPHRVVVELQSSWFTFPDGSAKAVTLEGTDRPVPFTVEATAAGRRSIRVLVRAGVTGPVIAERDIVVGSNAANRVALFITGAAALGLVALWARRLVRRART
jgi:hypothetical protein